MNDVTRLQELVSDNTAADEYTGQGKSTLSIGC